MGAEGAERLRGYLRRVTAELLETQERLAAAESGGEPIAIVGMACRFPGEVRSPEDFWRLIVNGGSGITDFPEDRNWNLDDLSPDGDNEAWRCSTRRGGFLHDAAYFDPGFFGISPREAVAMDPQHRLLLETVWEGLERTGIPPDSLRGSSTGVYIGMMSGDYAIPMAKSSQGTSGFDGFLVNGNTNAIASGRISYTLGLQGPAITFDTACSSGLVAVHDACYALRRGEISLALAGGVAVMSTPALLVEFSRQGGLAADGRCKPFAAAADGTSFADGAGMLVLQRLSDARRAGHQVLAIIRGSAVNQDGASNGLSAPSGAAQQQVIRQALANAGLTPDQVDAVEAHGTGTTLGDPIEGQALVATYGSRRAGGRPLLLGSVKSNIGHTQAAAGIAGVIKMVLAIRNGVLPPSLGIDAPTPHVDWSAGEVQLLTEATPWPSTGSPRRAGVSSFSLSGTNAHALIEQAPVDDTEHAEPGPALPAVPWTLSAKSAPALRAMATRLLSHLDGEPEASDTDIGFTLAVGRAVLRHRAVIIGADKSLRAGLEALARDEPADNLVEGAVASVGDSGPVFVFSGQGQQWAGMAAGLLESSPVFEARVRECVAAFEPFLDYSLLDVLWGRAGARALDEDVVIQPALFTVMVSLAAVWRSYGVVPAAVVGHSQGEIAAACVAGALSLPDAARLVALRGKPIRSLTGRGGMASLGCSLVESERLLDGLTDRLVVAAVNGPRSIAVSGDRAALAELVARCAADGIRTQRIPIDYASHSAQVDEIQAELRDVLGWLEPGECTVGFYSTVTAGLLGGRELGAGYWFENLRRPVNFVGAVESLLADGYRTFIECSAHPVLAMGLQGIVDGAGAEARVLGSIRRDDGGFTRFLTSVGEAHVQGCQVDWPAVFAGTGARRVLLPTYPFQRQRFWADVPPTEAGDVRAAGLATAAHPLLGAAIDLASGDGEVLVGRISPAVHHWIADHAVADTVLLPGTACIELAAHAAARSGLGGVEELTLQAPLVVPDDGDLTVQLTVGRPDNTGGRSVTLHSRPADGGVDEPWTQHAEGTLQAEVPGGTDPADWADLRGSWPPPDTSAVDIAGVYDRLAGLDYRYGPAFQGLCGVWRRGEVLFAEVVLPEAARTAPVGYSVHPALFDAAMHAMLVEAAADEGQPREPRLPFAWRGIAVHATGSTALRVRLARTGEESVAILAADHTGAPVLSVESLVTRPVAVDQLRAARGNHRDSLFRLDWPTISVPPGQPARFERCAVLGREPMPPVPHRYADLAALTDALACGDPVPEHVFAPLPLADDPSDIAASVRAALDDTLALVRAWLAEERVAGSRLVVLTRNAVALDGDGAPDLRAASVWGMIRSAQSEHPGRLVLADTDRMPGSDEVLLAALASGESQLVIRAGTIRVGRLVRATGSGATPVSRASGTVLITGGLGTLGGLVARHMVSQGARRLLLIGRRGAETPGATELVEELTGLGATVTVARCDAADRAALADVLAEVPADHPLTTVVHTAGLIDDCLVSALTPGRLDPVLRPKVDATVNLHELTLGHELSEFVLFSSVSGAFGGAGQANYAAANAFLDAFAQYRRDLGLPGQSLAWGPWAQGSGMTDALNDNDLRRFAAAGVTAMSSQEALALMDAASAVDAAALVTTRLDLSVLRGLAQADELPPVLRSLVRLPGDGAPGQTPGAGDVASWQRELAGLSEADQRDKLTDLVRSRVAVVLGHPASSAGAIDPDGAFKELGFDSLTSVELRNRLGSATGLRLPATLVFDYPTPASLAAYLLSRLVEEQLPDAENSVDAAVEHLRQAVSAHPLDDATRGHLVTQLKGLIREWTALPAQPAGPLESTSPDELLALLDEQLNSY